MLHHPAILKLEDDNDGTNCGLSTPQNSGLFGSTVPESLTEFYLKCPAKDKFLVVYALVKLKLIPTKCIIFTATNSR